MHFRKQLKHSLRNAKRWLHRVGVAFSEGDLLAEHQIQRKNSGDRQEFISLGSDPQFRLSGSVSPGWYMAEVQTILPSTRSNARFYFDYGQGESEKESYALPLRTGHLAKRLLHVDAQARLRFAPVEEEGEFTLRHFRLSKVTTRFATERIRRKLANLHPRYRPDGDLAASGNTTFSASKWADYNALFESHSQNALSYGKWIETVEAPSIPSRKEQQKRIATWAYRPLFSIILPTYNTPENYLRDCLDSVLEQSYPYWELCIADDASSQPHVSRILEEYARRDERIRVTIRERNGHISAASNTALCMATGGYIVLLDHDDTLAPHALFANASALQKFPAAQLLYSDEDKLGPEGERCDPFFKPDWSPDLLYSQNYIAHLSVYARQLVNAVGGFREGYEGSQDYDLVLRCTAAIGNPEHIVHIPMVLYHWRMSENSTASGHDQKQYATEAARKALQDHFSVSGTGVRVSITAPGVYRHHWPLPEPLPLVSLIIPTRDGYEHLKTCIESILGKTDYHNYEILIVDNQTTCPRTLDLMAEFSESTAGKVRVLRYDKPFNYSAINNHAAAHARGSVLGLVNNDVEVINPDWLSEMVCHAVRPDIGCVGAKLYYADGSLQHAGVVLGIGGVAGHSHKYFPGAASGYFSRLRAVHNVSAVTGAVLLVEKKLFEQLGGLDEGLEVAFNDVDFCLRVSKTGVRNLWTPFAELYHHESKTRGCDDTPEKRARFEREVDFMKDRWGDFLLSDPYYNINLTLLDESYSLGSRVVF